MGKLIDSLIPIDTCRRYHLLHYRKTRPGHPLTLVAMVDPDNLEAQDHLTDSAAPKPGVATHGSTLEDFQQIISKYLDEQVEQQKAVRVPKLS